jgi:hypothetical protein
MAVALSAPNALGDPASNCNDISQDVSSAILKDPSKVLMIVEDALVINESCACEIIKAAIVAAKADAAMVNQIVQTGISVAPKMAGVITDCATAVAPDANITSQATAVVLPVSEKNPSEKAVLPVAPIIEEDEDFTPVASNVRGIYLIQPPPSGFPPRKCHNDSTSPCNCSP